jgi:cytochrome o ubiquinol oxidase subunit II
MLKSRIARSGRLVFGARVYCALVILLGLGGCDEGIFAPAGRVARAENVILLDALAIMLAIVIPTLAAALIFAWWFRASNSKARYRPHWAYSGRLELLVWSVPTLVILFLAGVTWLGSHQLDPAKPLEAAGEPAEGGPADRANGGRAERGPLEVQVVSLDWKWLFIYPKQDLASVNHLVIPAGVPVHFSLTSASVMNVFFVPRLGSMIYAMNRMVTQLHLEADHPGDFFGESAQFSGDGFPYMTFIVSAVLPQDFQSWVATTRGSGPVLDAAAYTALSRQGVSRRPFTYRHLGLDVFEAIVSQKLPPGPGPQAQPSPRAASIPANR